MTSASVGIIGGSGLYDIEGLEDLEEVHLSTPFGQPSDAFLAGALDGMPVVFLSRHGRGHRVPPSAINFRANIWGLKSLGVTRVVSVSAVGSMREELVPGDFVVVDQFFDRTRHRADTFFDADVVAHVLLADPLCPGLRGELVSAASELGLRVHDGGTYLNMEGPQFSTRAESRVYRSWGMDVIGMTNLQEAKLAREAELCYATVAMVTDYDCWHESEEDVTIEAILAVMHKNIDHARRLIRSVVPRLGPSDGCACQEALRHAIITAPDRIPPAARDRLGLLIDKYLPR
jgi:5'-methylthioadenosine phosphorylase